MSCFLKTGRNIQTPWDFWKTGIRDRRDRTGCYPREQRSEVVKHILFFKCVFELFDLLLDWLGLLLKQLLIPGPQWHFWGFLDKVLSLGGNAFCPLRKLLEKQHKQTHKNKDGSTVRRAFLNSWMLRSSQRCILQRLIKNAWDRSTDFHKLFRSFVKIFPLALVELVFHSFLI